MMYTSMEEEKLNGKSKDLDVISTLALAKKNDGLKSHENTCDLLSGKGTVELPNSQQCS